MKRTIVALLATLPTEYPGVSQEMILRDMRALGLRGDVDLAKLIADARLAGAAIYVTQELNVCWSPTQDQQDRVSQEFDRVFC